jgi:phosphodiesterase/alkaline phosphatase D-like protein
MRHAAAFSLGLALCLSPKTASAQAPPPDFVDENMVTHGPILGRVSSDGVGVWARTLRTGEFSVVYGIDPKRLDQVAGPVATQLAHDNTGWIQISGLAPNTKYYYELQIPESTGRTGRRGSFRTLPSPAQYEDAEINPKGLFNFSFEFACGNNQNPRHGLGPALPTFATMLREIKDEVHFAILNGDWLYEVRRDYTPQQWGAQVDVAADKLPEVLQIAPTLAGVWENYKFFLDQGDNLSQWHREVPTFFTYDDHECLNDIWGAGTPGLRDRRAVFRDIGVQAWYDYLAWSNPTEFSSPIHFGRAKLQAGSDVLVDERADFTKLNLAHHNNLHVHWGTPTAGVNDNALDDIDDGVPNSGVYEIRDVLGPHQLRIAPAAKADGEASYSIGRRSYYRMRVSNCDFFVLDTRGQREMHDTTDPFKDISMLGRAQRQWLLDGVKGSDADFLFVVSSVNFMVPHVGGGAVRGSNKDDAWTVFFHERELLIDAFDQLKQPVFVLTGDLHNSFAIEITDNVYEFASGPHNSNNHWSGDEGDRPANGKFQYGPRECDILWSTWYGTNIPRTQLLHPNYCVVQVNNVFNNPLKAFQPEQPDEERWVAFPRPQVVFRYYDGRTGKLKFAHSVRAGATDGSGDRN